MRHDQVVDPGWSAAFTLNIPAGAASGLYAIQLVLGPSFDEADRSPQLFRALVVRPSVPRAGTRIAVIVPVNTWIAYNAWPGQDAHGGTGTPGVTSRSRTPGSSLWGGGNNSAYSSMGDGVSPSFYQGWRRPNSGAGLLNRSATGYFHNATMSLDLVRWLESYGAAYDVYSDWELEGVLPSSHDYRVIITHGHHEYWTRPALENLNHLADGGASLLNLGGNLFTWRVARSADGVSEVRKWPQLGGIQGPADRISGIDGEPIGLIRAIEVCRGSSLDYVLGTTLDLIADPQCSAASNPDCFGRWSAMNIDHWLWGGTPPAVGERFGLNSLGVGTVGHEADSWVPGHRPPGILSGQVPTVLAVGTDFGGPLPKLNNTAFDALSCADLEGGGSLGDSLLDNADASVGAGQITYYRHAGGGHVLSAASIASPSALGADLVFTGLITRALDCFAAGLGCPDEMRGPVDAGITDAATSGLDAASVLDGGGRDGGMSTGTEGGCGCRVVKRPSGCPSWLLAALALLFCVPRRRRKNC